MYTDNFSLNAFKLYNVNFGKLVNGADGEGSLLELRPSVRRRGPFVR